MRPDRPTRRRFLTILAASAAFGASAAAASGEYSWDGVAMGADARIVLSGIRRAEADAAIAAAVEEIERLEQSLSLFRDRSEISRLNRDGMLAAPGGDLVRALRLGLAVAAVTDGLFDPSVQALWEAHADWFAAHPSADVPPAARIAKARARVDWRRIRAASDRITLGRGQRITLNGLGQGYVTDRVADLLRSRGLAHVLVDLGEQRALGARADGTAWMVARTQAPPIPLVAGALATSEGAGCTFGAEGEAHHLFDPDSGRSAQHWRRITVQHRSAALADAFSTAFYAASPARLPELVRTIPGVSVWATDPAGRELRLSSPPG